MRRRARLAALLILALAAAGCVESKRTASGTVHTRTQTTATPTANGGSVTLTETFTETADESAKTTGFDPAVTQVLGRALDVATAGTPVGSILALFGGGSGVAAIGMKVAQTLADRRRAKDQAEKDAAWDAERKAAIDAAAARAHAAAVSTVVLPPAMA